MWHHYLLKRATQWNPFDDIYLLSKFDVSSFSVAVDIYRFCSLKLIFILLTLCRSKLTLSYLFYWLWMGHSYFIDLGKTYHKKPKNSRTRHRVWHKSFLMIQSAGIRKSFPQSINRPQMFSLLSLSVKRFSIFATK